MILRKLDDSADLSAMTERWSPAQGQRWIGFLVGGMAGAIAVAPLLLALAIPGRDESAAALFFMIAALLWMLAVVTYRSLSLAQERRRRAILRNEIAEIRRSRLEAGETFQEKLHTQIAILDRIIDIADSLLIDGIVDPITTLDNVRMLASHADEAKGSAEDAIAEVRLETGATSFNMTNLDVRSEIETIAAPFIRAGHKLSTGGKQCFADTDPAALRIIIRGLISRAIAEGAHGIDVAVARDGDRVVCTVADCGPDRVNAGLAEIPRISMALATAIGADIEHGYTLGWNRYGLVLPAVNTTPADETSASPKSVLGVARRNAVSTTDSRQLPRLPHDAVVEFAVDPDRDRLETVADRQRERLQAR